MSGVRRGDFYSHYMVGELLPSRLHVDIEIGHMTTEVVHVATDVTQPNSQERICRGVR